MASAPVKRLAREAEEDMMRSRPSDPAQVLINFKKRA